MEFRYVIAMYSVLQIPGSCLNEEQRKIFDHVCLPGQTKDALVIAGPGSGKTRTLIECVAGIASGVNPSSIFCITFTNNAAAEMKVRLLDAANKYHLPGLNRVHVSTFHSWVGQMANRTVSPRTYPPTHLESASLAVALHLFNSNQKKRFTPAEVQAAESYLEECETFDQMEARNFNRIREFPGNMERFERLKAATTALAATLPGNQIGTHGTLMRSGIDFADSLLSGSVSWLFIDEAQDVNATQARFVEAVRQSTGCRVFAIADNDQGIYKFRGASSRFLDSLASRESTSIFSLANNHRSTKTIVALCKNWIRPNWQATSREEKLLRSDRVGLPVVVLDNPSEGARSVHARMLLAAARENGLLDFFGETGVLVFSPRTLKSNFFDPKLPVAIQVEDFLPDDVLLGFKEALRTSKLNGDWHHEFWEDFLNSTVREDPKRGRLLPPGVPKPKIIGYPGLSSLLTALEAIRRLRPDATPAQVADWIGAGAGDKNLSFKGARLQPNYKSDECQVLSLHASKGMEFRAVWLADAPYAFSIKDYDLDQGQPGVVPTPAATDGSTVEELLAEANRLALEQENRRLLYVAMSRATDFLIISAPRHSAPNNEFQERDNAFHSTLTEALVGVPHIVLSADPDVSRFITEYLSDYQEGEVDYQVANMRNADWHPPVRYRIESFTSLHRQEPVEGEPTIPEGSDCPHPQSRPAMIGDQFHRIMHLLCLREDLLNERLAGKKSDVDLIAHVSTRPPDELPELIKLLASYFLDNKNTPWEWLKNAQSELPFAIVVDHPYFETEDDDHTPERILVNGFIDLVQYDDLSQSPVHIVDYKTGPAPAEGSEALKQYQAQIGLYRSALDQIAGGKHITASLYFPQAQYNNNQ